MSSEEIEIKTEADIQKARDMGFAPDQCSELTIGAKLWTISGDNWIGSMGRPVTAEYLHKWLPNVSGKLDSAIESAAEEWAHNLENERPEGALNWGGHIIIYYSVIGSNKVRERMLTDDELMQFWAWCIGTEQFNQL